MRKIAIITLASLTLTSLSIAQKAPGYMGKRISAHIDYNFFNMFNPETRPEYHSMFNFNDKVQVGVDYVLNRKTSVGGSFSTYKDVFKTKSYVSYNEVVEVKNPYYDPVYDNPSDEYYQENFQIYRLPSSEQADLSVTELNAHFKFFSSKDIAPIGVFNQIGIGLINYKITPYNNDGNGYSILSSTYSSMDYHIAYSQLKEESIETTNMLKKTSGMGINFNYSVGAQMIIKDWVFLRAAVSFNIPFLGVPIWRLVEYDANEYDEYSPINEDNYYHKLARRRIYARNIAYFTIGTGIIIN